MKFLVVSDVHGKVENLEKLQSEASAADGILFAGDFTQFNKPKTAKPCIEKMRSMNENIFGVLGNCDELELMDAIESQDMCCEKGIIYFEGLAIAGSGGGSKFTGTTPNERTEEELISDFDVIKNSELNGAAQWSNLIMISHNPPKDTFCDQCAPGVHVGSAMLTDFVKEIKPLALVTGHIHEGCAIDKIGETVVINPGALAEGKYAVLEVEKTGDAWKASAELKSLA